MKILITFSPIPITFKTETPILVLELAFQFQLQCKSGCMIDVESVQGERFTVSVNSFIMTKLTTITESKLIQSYFDIGSFHINSTKPHALQSQIHLNFLPNIPQSCSWTNLKFGLYIPNSFQSLLFY